MAFEENTVGAIPQETSSGLLDQIEVVIDLPTGPQGIQGIQGIGWIQGVGPPHANPDVPDDMPLGTLYLRVEERSGAAGNGDVHQKVEEGTEWPVIGNLQGPIGFYVPEVHDHPKYAEKWDSVIYRSLTVLPDIDGVGGGAYFTDPVRVAEPQAGDHAATKDYVDGRDQDLVALIGLTGFDRFLGQTPEGYSALVAPGNDWNNAQKQGIFQTVSGLNQPDGAGLSAIIGIVMSVSSGNCVQMVCALETNMWYTRTLNNGVWRNWATLLPFQSEMPPAGVAPAGSLWIQDTDTGENLPPEEPPEIEPVVVEQRGGWQ